MYVCVCVEGRCKHIISLFGMDAFLCMYVCMHACMYICMYAYTSFMHICVRIEASIELAPGMRLDLEYFSNKHIHQIILPQKYLIMFE
jgi:hypothetical protein